MFQKDRNTPMARYKGCSRRWSGGAVQVQWRKVNILIFRIAEDASVAPILPPILNCTDHPYSKRNSSSRDTSRAQLSTVCATPAAPTYLQAEEFVICFVTEHPLKSLEQQLLEASVCGPVEEIWVILSVRNIIHAEGSKCYEQWIVSNRYNSYALCYACRTRAFH